MSQVICIANHKGGVGKTTSVISIGAALANRGHKVLLVDLDAQANLTASFLPEDAQQRTIYEAFKERRWLPVVDVRDGLSIVPASLDLAGIELEIASTISRERVLSKLLSDVRDGFDFIILDCPPSLGLVTINAFTAADVVLAPMTAEGLPFSGLRKIEEVIGMVRDNLNPKAAITAIFLTRWQGVKLNRSVEEAVRELYGERLLDSKVRTNIALAEAPLAKEDIFSYQCGSNGAKDYEALTDELLEKKILIR